MCKDPSAIMIDDFAVITVPMVSPPSQERDEIQRPKRLRHTESRFRPLNESESIAKSILVVDDEPAMANVVSVLLESFGFNTFTAYNGLEALKRLVDGVIDLVLTDLQMPWMDGLALAGRIKATMASTPVIMMTGRSPDEVSEIIRYGPVDAMLFKPFGREALREVITQVLDDVSGPEKSRPCFRPW